MTSTVASADGGATTPDQNEPVAASARGGVRARRDRNAIDWRRLTVWAAGSLGIAATGLFDYASGTELRVYPLYYLPIGVLAWHDGRVGATVAALLSSVSWLYFNRLAGMPIAGDGIWLANTVVNGASFLFVGLLIASLRGAQQSALDLARIDPLTELRNSRAFYGDATPLLALCRRAGRSVSLAYLDLDNFKTVNDTRGHDAGDALLRAVASAMRETMRPSDLCARLGGDEFAILLPELGEAEALAALERLRVRVREQVHACTDPSAVDNAVVTASIGVVTFSKAPRDLQTMVLRADTLMYEAKRAGRDRISQSLVGPGSVE